MRRADRGVVLGLYRAGPDRDLLEYALSLGVGGIDTAYNYHGYRSHRILARVAADLLGEFTVSTKVGFFPDGDADGSSRHSLDPAELRAAIEQSADELGRTADVVFLHNPECSLAALSAEEGRDRLSAACEALADSVQAGWCRRWGIATWDARPVLTVTNQDVPGIQPGTLLLRAGLSVPEPVLTAGEHLSSALGVAPGRSWGISPFGGSTADPAWHTASLRAFLAPGQDCTTVQAAFRVAYELPGVDRLAVGTRSAQHLRQLVAGTALAVDHDAIGRYRELISRVGTV